uniref:hypothetical protein n=1 Tax=Hafnia alvei TaxID=569 RepID=UPI0026EE0420|nr:hypothetical protein [Hafnia alvei]
MKTLTKSKHRQYPKEFLDSLRPGEKFTIKDGENNTVVLTIAYQAESSPKLKKTFNYKDINELFISTLISNYKNTEEIEFRKTNKKIFQIFLKAYESQEGVPAKLKQDFNDPFLKLEDAMKPFSTNAHSKARLSFEDAMKRTKEKHALIIKKLEDN